MASSKIKGNRYKKHKEDRRIFFKRCVATCLQAVVIVSILGVLSFMYMFGYDLITQSSYFRAKHLHVVGVQRLSEKEVLDQVQIHPGINILSVNLSTARKQLLAHTWIADAEVSRRLPDEITIKITEQTPLAVIDLGRKFILNIDGEIFKEYEPSDPRDLPIVTGLRYPDINVSGEPRTAPFEAVINFLTFVNSPDHLLPAQFTKRIHVDKQIGLTLHIPDSESGGTKTVKLGYDHYPAKLKRLNTILIYLTQDRRIWNFDTIDLNDLDRIVVNPIGNTLPVKFHKEV